MRPRRSLADAELSGDFLVRFAGADDAKNLELASSHRSRQDRLAERHAGVPSDGVRWPDRAGARHDELRRIAADHLVGLCVFEQISGRAGVERGVHAGLLAERRECHHFDIAVAGTDLAGRGDAVWRRHLEVHQDDIGQALLRVEVAQAIRARGSPIRVSDEFEIRLTLEKGDEPAPHDGVVVNDEHANPLSLERHRAVLAQRNLDTNDGAASTGTRDRQERVDLGRPAPHGLEAVVPGWGSQRIEPASVVIDLDAHAVPLAPRPVPSPGSPERASRRS